MRHVSNAEKARAHPCVARVQLAVTTLVQCGARGKVEVDGAWYCGRHDPEKKAFRQKRRDEIVVERYRREAELAQAEERTVREAIQGPTRNPIKTYHGVRIFLTTSEWPMDAMELVVDGFLGPGETEPAHLEIVMTEENLGDLGRLVLQGREMIRGSKKRRTG